MDSFITEKHIMASKAFQPTLTRTDLSDAQKILRSLCIPDYLGMPWRYESFAPVRKRTGPGCMSGHFWPGYWLLVEVCGHHDCQTIYPNWWKKRQQWVLVSRQLFQANPSSVAIFWRLNRHQNGSDAIQAKLAK